MCARNITLEWVNKAEEDAAVAERESRVRKRPSPGAVCYHAQQCIENTSIPQAHFHGHGAS